MSENMEKPDLNRHLLSVVKFTLLLVLVICVGVAGFYYFQIIRKKTNYFNSGNQFTTLEQQVKSDQTEINTLKNAVAQLQAATQQSQALSAKQEQILGEWQAVQKGDMNKWYMAEAQYLVKLANDHAQYGHNIPMAISLLQRADQVLLPMQESIAIEIRQAIAANIAKLQAMPQMNLADMYAKLNQLDQQFNQLPLLSAPLSPSSPSVAVKDSPTDPWWKVGLNKTWQALQKIIIVRQTTSSTLPIVMPEEKAFLYQNLHAEMQNTMWAVMHQQQDVYQLSIERQIKWIQQYFIQDNATQEVLNQLRALQALNIQPQSASLNETVQLFNKYFSRAGAV